MYSKVQPNINDPRWERIQELALLYGKPYGIYIRTVNLQRIMFKEKNLHVWEAKRVILKTVS